MTSIEFWKMHGAGNDFVVVDPGDVDTDWSTVARDLCDRHVGVGADGLILVLPSQIADHRMRMFNPDGTEAEMCGNGIRCFVKFTLDRGMVESADAVVSVETIPGVLRARAEVDENGSVASVRVSMGVPAFDSTDLSAGVNQESPRLDIPIDVDGDALSLTLVSMGNPHAVQFIGDDVNSYDLARIGPLVEHHELFENRTNFEIVNVVGRSQLDMRVWERGAGETLACGSGACAAVVAARLHGRVDDSVEVHLPGGVLQIDWDGEGEVYLEGPAVRVFVSRWEGVFV